MLNNLKLNRNDDLPEQERPEDIALLLQQATSSIVESATVISEATVQSFDWTELTLASLPESLKIAIEQVNDLQEEQNRASAITVLNQGFTQVEWHLTTLKQALDSEDAATLNVSDAYETVNLFLDEIESHNVELPEHLVSLKNEVVGNLESSLSLIDAPGGESNESLDSDSDKESASILDDELDKPEELTLSSVTTTEQQTHVAEQVDLTKIDEYENAPTEDVPLLEKVKAATQHYSGLEPAKTTDEDYAQAIKTYKSLSSKNIIDTLPESDREQYKSSLKEFSRAVQSINQHIVANAVFNYIEQLKSEDSSTSNKALTSLENFKANYKKPDTSNAYLIEAINQVDTILAAKNATKAKDQSLEINNVETNATSSSASEDELSLQDCGIAKNTSSVPFYTGKTSLSAKTAGLVQQSKIKRVNKALGFLDYHKGFDLHQVSDANNNLISEILIHRTARGMEIREHNDAYEFAGGSTKHSAKTAVKLAQKRGWSQVTAWGSRGFISELNNYGRKYGVDIIPIDTQILSKLDTYRNVQAPTLNEATKHVVSPKFKQEQPSTSDLAKEIAGNNADAEATKNTSNKQVESSKPSPVKQPKQLSDYMAEKLEESEMEDSRPAITLR